MDAAPQVAPIGHVAGLAVPALARIAARLPFRIGVFQQFAVEGETVRLELVAAGAEARVGKGGAHFPAVVR